MTWEEWLNTKKARSVLSKCASYIIKKYPWITDILMEVDPEALVGELWIYCRSNSEKWDKIKPIDSMVDRRSRSIINWIVGNFFKFMIDRIRTFQYSPQKYLYARIRKALTSDGASGIKTHVYNKATYYTCSEELKWGHENCFNLQEGDYREWPFPGDVIAKDIYHEKLLIYVAEFFWKEVKNRTGNVLWIPVQQLLRYILSFISVPAWHCVESTGRSDDDNDSIGIEIEDSLEFSIYYSDSLNLNTDRLLTSLDIGKLAEKCALILDSCERKVLELYYLETYSMKEIAEKLGYSGPSGVHYILEKAHNRIRKFCEHQPYLSPPDLDEKLFNNFINDLLVFCKKLSRNRNKKCN